MKKNLKFLVAVLAVGALTSCTDELIDSQKQVVKDGDLVGYLQSPTEDVTRVAYAPDINGYVWADDDAIRVYTLDKLLYGSYNLTGGQGTQEGIFTPDGAIVDLGSGKKYAVTQPQPKPGEKPTIYAISAEDGQAMLTATVNPRYDWDDVIEMNDGSKIEGYKLPTPFWGEATVKNNNVNVNFKALTSFIKLDLRRVPVGTQAIVLTSHEDYYTVAPKNDPSGLAELHTGGANEPLAGTMKAILEDGAALEADTRLVSHDTLRIDFDKVVEIAGEDKIFYIPVPAQRYAKLDLLAVSIDNRAPYTWTEAELLASWTDEEFIVGKTKGVYLDAEYEIDATDPEEISTIIAQRFDGSHDVRVKLNNEVDAGTIYILNNGQKQGLEYTNVEITFTQQQTNAIEIVECPANIVPGGAGNIIQWMPSDPTLATIDSKSKEKKQTVKLNFEGGATADTDIYLPESDVVLSADDDFAGVINIIASRTNRVSGYESVEKNMKKAGIILKGGNQFAEVNVLSGSEKTAVYAYEDNTEILELNINPKQPGSIRLTDALVAEINFEATDIVGNPAIITTGAAAIKDINYDRNKVKVQAYWTGKSLTDYAVQNGYEGAQVQDDEQSSGVVYTAAQLQAMGLDKGLDEGGSSFTSGAGVLEYLVSKKVGFIWLGGEEFPWIGPQIGIMQGDQTIDGNLYSNRQLVDPDFTLTDPYDTQEFSDPVEIDFNHVEMRNMEMTINDPYFIDPHKCCTSCGDFVVKVERDLGLVRCINTTSTADVLNLRLNDVELLCTDPKVNIPNVGSVVGRISADDDVTMDDNRVTNLQISIAGGNVGGHVGNILSEGGDVEITKALSGQYNFTIGDHSKEKTFWGWGKYNESAVGVIFVETIGENAGGLVGQILAPAGRVVIADDVRVGLNWIASDGYKTTGGNNVGGLVGNLAYGAGTVTTTAHDGDHDDQFTQIADDDADKDGVEDNVSVLRATVNVDDIVTNQAENNTFRTNDSQWGETGCNAGGFAGKSWAVELSGDPNFDLTDATSSFQMVVDGTVNCQMLKAQNRYAGGLIGYNKQPEATTDDHVAATFISCETNAKHDTYVTITDVITGIESVTGGLIGQQVMGDLVIGGGALKKNEPVAKVVVDINMLSTAFAGGGLVGQNLDDVDIDTWYRADYESNKKGYIIVNVADWNNTWSANDVTGGYAGETVQTLRKYCGSFDNLAGLVSEHFKVMNAGINYDKDGNMIFGVHDKDGNLQWGIETLGLIPNAKKKALLFQLHTDTKNTKGVDTDPYWGDQIGYVGYADQTSFYLLEGSDYRQGDQEFNYRFPY